MVTQCSLASYLLPMNEPPTELLTAASIEMRDFYWKKKDLAGCLRIAREAIQIGQEAADDFPDVMVDILSLVKRLTYDVASFTWIGWDEPGISPTDAEIAEGLEMARLNLQYAIQLQKGDLPTSRAYWMVGAHLLTSNRASEAVAEFEEAESFAILSGSQPDIKLCQGYLLLATQASDRSVSSDRLNRHLTEMDENEETAGLTQQIRTAAKIIGF